MMTIYKLYHPRTGEIFYVGKTNNLERRYKQHLTIFRDKNYYLAILQNTLRNQNLQLSIGILETCSDEDASQREKYWIEKGISENWPLTNKVLAKAFKKKEGIPALVEWRKWVFSKVTEK